jgi:hypothetical protein
VIIKFTNVLEVPEEFTPIPASKTLPDWYKNLDSYFFGEKKPVGDGAVPTTAKRCMPLFDSMASGYIISTHTDFWVSQRPDETGNPHPYYEWPSFEVLGFHKKEQLPEHPDGEGHRITYPKWHNAWGIETPPGYSCLFIPPLHRETPIVALPGVVDTDTYTAPVNFPFVLKDPKMEGLIPAGTPIIQVIPFKREAWQMELGTGKDLENAKKVSSKLRIKFFDSYKTQFRQPKEYR